MELFYFNIIFWSIIYIVDAYADSNVSVIIRLSNIISYPKTDQHSARWHNSRLIYYALFHLLFSFTIYLISANVIISLAHLLLSFEIKLLVRGTFLSIFMHLPIFRFTCQGSWDWFDCFLVWIKNKIGINPAIIIYLQFIIFLIMFIIFYT